MRTLILFLLMACLVLFNSCRSEKDAGDAEAGIPSSLFSRVEPSDSKIDFTNVLTESDSVNPVTYQYVYNGSGVAVGDINNDGLPDVFFAANMVSSRLYVNRGNFVFGDITSKAGVATQNWCNGVTMADVNADGFLDIYVCQSGKHKMPGQRRNLLFINNGNLTFTEKAAEFGLDDPGYSCQATFFDYDRDGDLDVFVINQPVDINFVIIDKDIHNKKINPYTSSRFYKNSGNNRFVDVSAQAGIQSNAFSLSATAGDLDNDGWLDLYVCNDYLMSDFLYINDRKGGFREESRKRLGHTSAFAMGSDIGDINNDGWMDILQTDMLPEDNYRQKMLLGPNNYDKHFFMVEKGYGDQYMQNCLQVNNGNGMFSEVATFAGIEKTDWSWAALFADLDNDGLKDIFIDNGYIRDYTNLDQIMYRSEILRRNKGKIPDPLEVVKNMPTTPVLKYLYKNNGDLTFSNKTVEWGFTDKTYANGAAYADLDNDGDLDLLMNNLNGVASVYKNNATRISGNHFITFNCVGDKSNPDAIGTVIWVYTRGLRQTGYVMPVRGFCSAVDKRVHFGLGANQKVDSVVICWPDGKALRLYQLDADTIISVKYKNTSGVCLPRTAAPVENFFAEKTGTGLDFRHRENAFIDYKREPLLPQLYSRPGPALAAGDVNNDGIDDIYVGGAKGQAGILFTGAPNGRFRALHQPDFEKDREQEDADALFFDADNDLDADLYVVSGGSEISGYSPFYQDRLYLNNGKGVFHRVAAALPEINSSGSCIVAADMDGDFDLDLFRGGRVSPGNYPFHPRSYLLRNDRGRFTDVSETAPNLSYTGMVTTALWQDLDEDKDPDLILTGEWMPVKIFRNSGGRLSEATNISGLDYSNGWWNCLAIEDFDMDGDPDMIAGNMGTNTRIRTSLTKPANVYAKDFDANGTTDAIISHLFSDSLLYPMASRDELLDQIRSLRKTLYRYSDYANKTIDQIFSSVDLKSALFEKAYTFHSCYFENKGNGVFEMRPLPLLTQISPVNCILTGDFNRDGFPDALIAGNNHYITPAQGKLDAGTGLLLAGDGKGNLKAVSSRYSGFYAGKMPRKMVRARLYGNQRLIVIGNNDDEVQLFLEK